MRKRAARTARGLPAGAKFPFEDVAVFSFKDRQAGVEQFALGDYDDVKPLGDFVATKDLSYQTFSAISLHRPADFLRGGDAEPAGPGVVPEDEDRAETAMQARALVV